MAENPKAESGKEEEKVEVAGDGQSYKDLYTASQKGAIELKHQKEELEKRIEEMDAKLEQANPILEAFEKDPEFFNYVKGYKKEKPVPEKHSELGDNLEYFDMSEALANPNSPSGKFLAEYNRSIVDKTLEEKLLKYDGEKRFESKLEQEKIAYLSEHPELSEQELDDLVEKTKKRNLTFAEMIDLVRENKNTDTKVDVPKNRYAYPAIAQNRGESQPVDEMKKFKKAIESTADDGIFGELMR